MEKYSVVLLKECKIENYVSEDDAKIFEESVVLCEFEDDFFEETSPEELLEYFAKKIPANKYTNAYGEEVSVEVVAVIDYFNLFENVEFDNFTEIYCRHFIEKKSMVVADVIEKYYPDFSITK